MAQTLVSGGTVSDQSHQKITSLCRHSDSSKRKCLSHPSMQGMPLPSENTGKYRPISTHEHCIGHHRRSHLVTLPTPYFSYPHPTKRSGWNNKYCFGEFELCLSELEQFHFMDNPVSISSGRLPWLSLRSWWVFWVMDSGGKRDKWYKKIKKKKKKDARNTFKNSQFSWNVEK